MAKLVDMKRSKAERKEIGKPSSTEDDAYPYGLTIHLDHAQLEKLGVATLPKAGDKLHLQSEAHVRSVESRHDAGGKKNNSMSIQLRKMALAATQRADHEDVEEGKLRGAKAAMDQALDAQEGKKKKG